MRLKAMFPPDAPDGARANAELLGHCLAAPMSRRFGRFLGGHSHDEPPGLRLVSVFAATPGLIELDAGAPFLQETGSPAGRFLARYLKFFCNLVVSLSIGRQNHDQASLDQAAWSQAALNRFAQPIAVFLGQIHWRGNSHPASLNSLPEREKLYVTSIAADYTSVVRRN